MRFPLLLIFIAFSVLLHISSGIAGPATDQPAIEHFSHALNWGKYDKARQMAEELDVNSRGKNGKTPLLITAWGHDPRGQEHRFEIAQILIGRGADINAKDDRGNTPLMAAAFRGSLNLVHYFIRQGANVQAKNKDNKNAISIAISRGYADIVKLLLEKDSSPAALGIYARQAVISGSLPALNVLFEKGADVNERSEHHGTLLMAAAGEGRSEIVWALLDKGADVNAQDGTGKTALMHAMMGRHKETVRHLLAWGANKNITDEKGRTALMLLQDQDYPSDHPFNRRGNKEEMASLLNTTSSAPEQPEKPIYIPHDFINKAKTGTATQRFELGRAYYYGLKNIPVNYGEAYYWISICNYELADTKDDFFQNMKAMAYQSLHDRTKIEEGVAMQRLLVDPNLKESCSVFLRAIEKKLTAQERKRQGARVAEWKRDHPRPEVKISVKEQRKYHLTMRLNMEVVNNTYDFNGIAKMIAEGAILNHGVLTAAAEQGHADIVKMLVSAGAPVNDKIDNESEALRKAYIMGYDDIALYLQEKGARLGPRPVHKKPLAVRPGSEYIVPDDVVEHPGNGLSRNAIMVLKTGTAQEKSAIIKQVKAAPEKYNPHVLGAMADVLFARFLDDDGLFWGIAAQLRYSIDREICKRTVRTNSLNSVVTSRAYDYYEHFEPEIFRKRIDDVIAWNERTPVDYNMQWGEVTSRCQAKSGHSPARKRVYATFRHRANPQGFLALENKKAVRIEDILQDANAGDAEAQYKIGWCYINYNQCELTEDDAMIPFDHWAAQERAQEGRSTKLYYSSNGAAYAQKALPWLNKAVAKGHVLAMYELTRLYLDNPLLKDLEQGCALLKRMQDQDLAPIKAHKDQKAQICSSRP